MIISVLILGPGLESEVAKIKCSTRVSEQTGGTDVGYWSFRIIIWRVLTQYTSKILKDFESENNLNTSSFTKKINLVRKRPVLKSSPLYLSLLTSNQSCTNKSKLFYHEWSKPFLGNTRSSFNLRTVFVLERRSTKHIFHKTHFLKKISQNTLMQMTLSQKIQ